MKLKVFSVLYNSEAIQGKQGMLIMAAEDAADALRKTETELIKTTGDLKWKPSLVTNIDLEFEAPVQQPIALSIEDETKYNQNWVLRKIIENKDLVLYSSVSDYLSKNEKQYVANELGIIISEGTA